MGCAGSSQSKGEDNIKKVRKPKLWKHPQSISMSELKRMREEFWDTAPHYGGQKEIWDALRAAAESDVNQAQTIVDCAGIILANADMTTCYDEKACWLPSFFITSAVVQMIPCGLMKAFGSTGGDQRLLFSYSKPNSERSENLKRSSSETRLGTNWILSGEAFAGDDVLEISELDMV